MLTLHRREGEAIQITVPPHHADTIITILLGVVHANRASIKFDAPQAVTILRSELLEEGGEA